MSVAIESHSSSSSLHRRSKQGYHDVKTENIISPRVSPGRSAPCIGAPSKMSPNPREARIVTKINKPNFSPKLSPRGSMNGPRSDIVRMKSSHFVPEPTSEDGEEDTDELLFPSIVPTSRQSLQPQLPTTNRLQIAQPSTQHSAVNGSLPGTYARVSTVGLKNLGNTCFMNSALQCIFHIEPLVSYFLRGDYLPDINKSSPMQGSLALSFAELVKDMFRVSSGSIVSPGNFKRIVTKLAPHLLDYEQQDCQEFLRFLLDGLSDDLAREYDSGAIDREDSSASKDAPASPSTGKERPTDNTVSPIDISYKQTIVTPHPPPAGTPDANQAAGKVRSSCRHPFSSRTAERIRSMTSEAQHSASTPSSSERDLQLSSAGGHSCRGVGVSSLNQLSSVTDSACKDIDNSTMGPLQTQKLSRSDGAADIKHLEKSLPAQSTSTPSPALSEEPNLMPTHVSIKGPSVFDITNLRNPIATVNSQESNCDSVQPVGQGKLATIRTLKQQQQQQQQKFQDRSSKSGIDCSDRSDYTMSEMSLSVETGGAAIGTNKFSPSLTITQIEYAMKESEKSWATYLKKNNSIITDIFGGQLQSSIECLTCHHRSLCFDPFLDLSIPIVGGDTVAAGAAGDLGRRGREPAKCTLQACLEEFSAMEVMDDDNAYSCEKCKAKRKSVKRLTIYKYPRILVLHIKRFRYTTFRREKMSTDVDFPVSGLDITPFISAELQSEHTNVCDRQTPLYDLAGVAHHSGSMAGGHYIAHVDTQDYSENGQQGPAETSSQHWMCFNDTRVSNMSSNSIGGPSAYILFYRLRST